MEKQLQPKLRFPEFSGDWKKTNIKDISVKITDGTHDTPKTISEGNMYITAIHVKDGYIDYDNCYYIDDIDYNKILSRTNPEKGDLLMVNIGAGTATSALIKIENKFGLKNVALIKPNKEIIEPSFLEQVQRMNSKRLKHQLSSGGAQPFLSLKQISKLKLNIPPLPEQQKIADYLTIIDRKIELLTEKKTELSRYKKAMMQKLFSQEIRFKDENGNDYSEWEEKRLGDLLSIPAKIIDKTNNYDKLLTVKLHLKGVHVNDSTNGLKVGGTNYYIRKKGQFIYGKQNLFNGGFGIIPDELDGFLSSGDVPSLDINTAKLNGKYLLNYFSRENFYTKLESLSSGTGSKRIHEKTLFLIEINLPSLPEQQKIANFLSAIDDNITKVEEQIKETQNFKKAMLQQLFV